jgi:regulator of cell morphogenesis and NO signaling
MVQAKKMFVLSEAKMAELISENPDLMLMLEHFGIALLVHDKTVRQLCKEHNISEELFLSFANLFNGFQPSATITYSFTDLKTIILFLRNTHQYYLEEKYPQIRSYIAQMFELNDQSAMLMVEKFFDQYFAEVKEHLQYEDQIVFTYVNDLFDCFEKKQATCLPGNYSVSNYQEHHDDIEDKLEDLKNLLLKHLPLDNDQQIRRKLLFSLFELEYDLNIHTRIEDEILIPLVEKMERTIKTSYGK